MKCLGTCFNDMLEGTETPVVLILDSWCERTANLQGLEYAKLISEIVLVKVNSFSKYNII